jgi:hypothetical protein
MLHICYPTQSANHLDRYYPWTSESHKIALNPTYNMQILHNQVQLPRKYAKHDYKFEWPSHLLCTKCNKIDIYYQRADPIWNSAWYISIAF